MNSYEYYKEELLPQLSNEDIVALFKKKEIGDLSARQKIIEHNISLVLSRLNIYSKYYVQEPELIFEYGIIGLINAVDTYNLEKGIRFSTYAVQCIDNKIKIGFKYMIGQYDKISIDTPIQGSDDLTIYDNLSDESDDFEKILDHYIYEKALEIILSLTDDIEKNIIIDRYGLLNHQQLSIEQLISKYKISKQGIYNIINRIKKKIKQELKEPNL